MTKKKRYFKLNERITAKKVRVIASDGTQIGVMPIDKALKKAKEEGLDLVEVAPKASPPVAKIVNFREFLNNYLDKVRGSKSRSAQNLKEVRLKPYVDEHDLNIKLEKIKDFLTQKQKVKVTINFFGRAITHKELGDKLMTEIADQLQQLARVESGPTLKGRRLILFLAPKSK